MNERPSYYAVIPATVRYDINIPAEARLLYAEITALCNKTGECWASNAYFAKLYGVTKGTVSRWISLLAGQQYLGIRAGPNGERLMTVLIPAIPPTQKSEGGGSEKSEAEYYKHENTKKNTDTYPPAFEEWWAVYPKKVEKKGAYRKWETARKQFANPSAASADLLAAARNYAAYVVQERTGVKFVKHPATFLGPAEPWRDWLEPRKDKVETNVKPKFKGWVCPKGHQNTNTGSMCLECGEERAR